MVVSWSFKTRAITCGGMVQGGTIVKQGNRQIGTIMYKRVLKVVKETGYNRREDKHP